MEKTVLLVDDDQEIVNLLATLFLQHGWIPQCTTSGEDALRCAARTRPDAVVCDLSMPGITGFEVALSLRRLFGADCPVLLAFTAWPLHDVQKHALNAGFDAVLPKPSEFERVLATLQKYLSVGHRNPHRVSTEAMSHAS